jgi:DNA-directed RNA polymerase I subunit RPA2
MIQKLYAFSAGECAADNPDSPQHQEILLGGHLYANIMKEKMIDILEGIKQNFRKDLRLKPASVNFSDSTYNLSLNPSRKVFENLLCQDFNGCR